MYEYSTRKEIYEDDEEMGILYDIQVFADITPSFNTKFIDGIEDFIKKYRYISDKQYNILVDVYNNIQNTKQKTYIV